MTAGASRSGRLSAGSVRSVPITPAILARGLSFRTAAAARAGGRHSRRPLFGAARSDLQKDDGTARHPVEAEVASWRAHRTPEHNAGRRALSTYKTRLRPALCSGEIG